MRPYSCFGGYNIGAPPPIMPSLPLCERCRQTLPGQIVTGVYHSTLNRSHIPRKGQEVRRVAKVLPCKRVKLPAGNGVAKKSISSVTWNLGCPVARNSMATLFTGIPAALQYKLRQKWRNDSCVWVIFSPANDIRKLKVYS